MCLSVPAKAVVSCPVLDLTGDQFIQGKAYAEKFIQAVTIAKIDPYRAVTHNKGIMNGVDAVVIATGNDFRAIEAGVMLTHQDQGSTEV